MDFTLTDEQEMVRETARSLFDKECDIDFVRAGWQRPAPAYRFSIVPAPGSPFPAAAAALS